jgi:hypothetical protein
MTKSNYEKKLASLLANDMRYQVALNLIHRISEGRIWLIGSAIYKNLLNLKHGSNLSIDDYDFIVEKMKKPLPELTGWEISENTFGNIRLKKDGITIDPVPLNNILMLREWGWQGNLKNFMKSTGFSVQTIAYNIKNKKLITKRAVKDISKGIIRINNMRNYEWSVARYGEKVSLTSMANKLGLRMVPPGRHK